ncbi:MAG TPA: hypothetical protein GXX45_28525 [Pseudomonas aeruginosa]|nr:hypothetical protein [Pseudomonas aeruginosa]
MKGIVVGDINTKKLIIKKEGQLYYNREKHSFLKMSRNGKYLSIMKIRETLNERDITRAVFIDRLLKQAEKFINSREKDKHELTIEAPHVDSKEIPKFDAEASVNSDMTAPIQGYATYMLSDMAITRQVCSHNCAMPVHSDMAPTQEADVSPVQAEAVPRFPQGTEKQDEAILLHTHTLLIRKETVQTQPHPTAIQEEAELAYPDASLLQGEMVLMKPHAAEKQEEEVLSGTLRYKRKTINFINTY